MFIETVRIQSLSNNSYVVGSEQSGKCAVIDPARDIDQYTNIASNHGGRSVYALETHLHNDFISGVRELAAQTGCQVGSSASGGLLYPSVRLQDDGTFDLGEFQLRILHTPGHTPESISFMGEEQGEIRAVFTGGALLLGGAARVDLLGSRVAPYLARWLHQTITESCSNCRTRSRSTLPTAGAPSAQRLARAAVRFRRPLAKNGNTIHLRPTPRKTTSASSPSPAWGPTPVTTATWPTSTAAAPTFWAECPGWRL